MNKKAGIVFLNPVGFIGGAEKGLINLCNTLKDEFDINVILFSKGPFEGLLKENKIDYKICQMDNEIFRLSRHDLSTYNIFHIIRILIKIPLLLKNILKIIRSFQNVRIIYSNGIKTHLLSVFLRIFLFDKFLVWHFRDASREGIVKRVFKKILWIPDLIFANSLATAKSYDSKNRIIIAYNSIIHFEKECISVKDQENIPVLDCLNPIFLSMGNLAPIKGFDKIIKAFGMYYNKFKKGILIIAGEEAYHTSKREFSGYKEKLVSLTESLGLSERVIFTGFVDDPLSLIKFSDFVLIASETEGFGRTAVEGMFMNKPVISTLAGGLAEIIIDNVNGFAIKNNSPEEIFLCLEKTSALSQEKIDLIRRNAYHYVMNRFGIRGLNKIKQHLKEIVD